MNEKRTIWDEATRVRIFSQRQTIFAYNLKLSNVFSLLLITKCPFIYNAGAGFWLDFVCARYFTVTLVTVYKWDGQMRSMLLVVNLVLIKFVCCQFRFKAKTFGHFSFAFLVKYGATTLPHIIWLIYIIYAHNMNSKINQCFACAQQTELSYTKKCAFIMYGKVA